MLHRFSDLAHWHQCPNKMFIIINNFKTSFNDTLEVIQVFTNFRRRCAILIRIDLLLIQSVQFNINLCRRSVQGNCCPRKILGTLLSLSAWNNKHGLAASGHSLQS